MYWTKIIVNFVLIVVVVTALFHVSKKPTAKKALRWGAVLVAVGLAGSLAINLEYNLDPVLLTFLSNICLLVAGLGGNFIVGAAVMESVHTSGTLSGTVKGEVFDLNNPPTKIGNMEGTFDGDVHLPH